MPRAPDTPLQKLEKQIRTFTWFQYVLDRNDVKNEKFPSDEHVFK